MKKTIEFSEKETKEQLLNKLIATGAYDRDEGLEFDKQSNDTSNNYESELMDIAKQFSKKTDYCLLMKYRSMLAAISYNSPYKSV